MIPEHTEPSPAGLLKLAGFAMGLFAVQTFWGFTWATLPLYLKELTGSNAGTGVTQTGHRSRRQPRLNIRMGMNEDVCGHTPQSDAGSGI